MVPKHSAEVLSRVSKHETVMCLRGKIYILDKLQSDMSYSAVGHEYNTYESIIYNTVSLNKTHIKPGYILIG